MDYDEYVKYARPGDRLCISDEELATMDAEAYRISQAKRDEPVSPIVAATAPEPAVSASQGVPERKTKRLTLAQMIAAGRYDGYVNPDITEKNFPVKPELFSTGGTKLFHFNRAMTTAEIEAEIRVQGYDLATIEQLLAYGAENPEEQHEHPIVALGSSWVAPGSLRVHRGQFLVRHGAERALGLSWDMPGDQWSGRCRFLAFRKSST